MKEEQASGNCMARALHDAMEHVGRLRKVPGVGGLAASLPEWDGELWRMGRERLRSRWKPWSDMADEGSDVYIASQLYADGGHTALIGDFVRALSGMKEHSSPRLIVTNIHHQHGVGLEESIQSRTGIRRDRTSVLAGESLGDCFDQLAEELLSKPVRRLFHE